eukprot:4897602-Alexandrium_andersonii.AAC.1
MKGRTFSHQRIVSDAAPYWTSTASNSPSTGEIEGVHQPSPDLGDLTRAGHRTEACRLDQDEEAGAGGAYGP